jgi:nitrous oxidase accessory protein
MNSNNAIIKNNLSLNDRDYGIMLNYTNKSIFEENIIKNTGDRCVFIYNSHKNSLLDNRFERCNIGINFTAGSERNKLSGNAFLYNRTQVKYVGTKWVDWSVDGKGNFWSDHAGFDLDSNGIADSIYRPNDVMDRILWTQPAAKSLLGSPAVQLIKWSQSTFPALLPGGVVDKAPMMRPVELKMPIWNEI